MVTHENEIRTTPSNPSKQSQIGVENGENSNNSNKETMENNLLNPDFKSVAAMAGWDEETLLFATHAVEGASYRNPNREKRPMLMLDTPPSNSTRKRRIQQQSSSAVPIPVIIIDDDDEDESTGDKTRKADLESVKSDLTKKIATEEKSETNTTGSCSRSSTLPCMDHLRDELSCAICLDICFEPSTTPCGHSFCKECLRSAADKCGKKCPKCRQFISNGRDCTINTVLWNTIQLLFPEEVQARKEAAESNSRVSYSQNSVRMNQYNNHHLHATRRVSDSQNLARMNQLNSHLNVTRRSGAVGSRRFVNDVGFGSTRGVPTQDNDSALALRLQQEFMAVDIGVPTQDYGSALALRLQGEEFLAIDRDRGLQREEVMAVDRGGLQRELMAGDRGLQRDLMTVDRGDNGVGWGGWLGGWLGEWLGF